MLEQEKRTKSVKTEGGVELPISGPYDQKFLAPHYPPVTWDSMISNGWNRLIVSQAVRP